MTDISLVGRPSQDAAGRTPPGGTALALCGRAAQIMLITLAAAIPAACTAAALMLVRGRAAGRRYAYRRIARLLMALGPTFVKAGQVLGTRRDVLPAGLCDELSVLQDTVAPLDSRQAAQALADCYGQPGTVFSAVDDEPVASGSVASVYRATLIGGREVAIKLRRPGIEAVMRADLGLIRRGAAVAARLPAFRGVPVSAVIGAMGEAVLGQLDFAREARSLSRLRQNLAVVPRVWVPRVLAEQSRPGCIVMEFIPGLDTGVAARCPAAMRRRFAASALVAIYQMLFVDGFVHCDMHPGNLYFTREGQVVVLDAGFSVQLTERLRRLFAEFFLNMAIGRGGRCAEIVVESSAGWREDADLKGFLAAMADLVHRSHGLSAKDFSLMAFATEMFDLQRKHGIHAAAELIFPLLSLLVIEGTIRDLDPDIDFQETARPVLSRGLFSADR
jgi:ubiquinone biosynthesis protein